MAFNVTSDELLLVHLTTVSLVLAILHLPFQILPLSFANLLCALGR